MPIPDNLWKTAFSYRAEPEALAQTVDRAETLMDPGTY